MQFDFIRSHGLGNDYLVMDGTQLGFDLTPERIRLICDRHLGIGSDGILLRVDTRQANFGVRILNPDGSEAEKSGNGLRIFARFLHDHGYTRDRRFTIETPGGIVTAELYVLDDRVEAVKVDMGRATIDRGINQLDVDGKGHMLNVVSVSVGNPHCVVIVEDLEEIDLFKLGPLLENHPAFPNRTNVQFAQVLSREVVRALIWERGAGHTLASGSSSCAVAVACFDLGLVDGKVTVEMEGGNLDIELDEHLELVMTGPVEEICSGCFCGDLKRRLLDMPDGD